jgi:hypothetical protein
MHFLRRDCMAGRRVGRVTIDQRQRIAAAGDFMVLAGWHEAAGFRVFHFPTWAEGSRYAALD